MRVKETLCWEYMLCGWCGYETLHREGECMNSNCLEPRKKLEREVGNKLFREVVEGYKHRND